MKYTIQKIDESVPGVAVTKNAQGESKKGNDKYYSDVQKKMKDYEKPLNPKEDNIEEPKYEFTDEAEEYHRLGEIMNGLEMFRYDNEPSEQFKERARMGIEGDSKMGNAQTDEPVWGASDKDFGKKLVKSIKKKVEKENDAVTTYTQFGDDIELVPGKESKLKNKKVAIGESSQVDGLSKIKAQAKAESEKCGCAQHVNKTESGGYSIEDFYDADNTVSSYEDGRALNENNKQVTESKMKRLKFKQPFNGIETALKVIPESYKEDKKVFEMTDGNENYKIRWEGDTTKGRAIVLEAYDKSLIKEDMDKIFHLMGYNPASKQGTIKGKQRIEENVKFFDLMKKAVNESAPKEEVLTESEEKGSTAK